MSQEKQYGLPFVVKEMLRFAEGQQPTINVDFRSAITGQGVNIRGYTRDGTFDQKYTTLNSNYSKESVSFRVPDIPIVVQVSAQGTGLRRGALYCRVSLQMSGFDIAVLCAGYVSEDYSVNYPFGKIEGPTEGPGLMRSITGTNPAAGAEVIQSVPANTMWRLHAITVTLVTDATAVNRVVKWRKKGNTAEYFRIPHGVLHGGSTTGQYTLAMIGSERTAFGNTSVQTDILQNRMSPADTVETITDNLQAGDDYGAPQLLIEQWASEA